ncbi:MAG TPA: hypothetical protein VN767_25835 [Streptosporangiaceae bacterium]|nr:hypothetical protein [Streptosporangiaceae bacterium]
MGRQFAAALGAALIATSALTSAGPAQATSPSSLPLARPALVAGRSGELVGVYCTSATNCWAVGDHSTKLARLNQVLRWTGKQWFKVVVPEPGGTGKDAQNELSAVRCTSTSNCWAVGLYVKNGAELDQILHWTGKKWFVVPAPTPAGTLKGDLNQLIDVACISAASCWAVGDYGTDDSTVSGEIIKNQALRWNGKTWSLISTPDPAPAKKNHVNLLTSVRCASPANCWAVGTSGAAGKKFILSNEMLHWTGKKWNQVIVPNPAGTAKGSFNELTGLSCTSAKNCLASGVAAHLVAKGKELNVILRWNGTKWVKDQVPNPDGTKSGSVNQLNGVTCASARDCWAVGSVGGVLTEGARNQALHWTGTKWKVVPTPNPAGTGQQDSNRLNSIRCTSPGNCWAVGVLQHNNGANQDEALHWNGASWHAS